MSDTLSKMWSSSNESLSTSSGFHSPGSPASLSPVSTSPINTLQRRHHNNHHHHHLRPTPSCESFVIHSDCRDSRSQSPDQQQVINNDEDDEDEASSTLVKLLGWYPCFLLRIVKAIFVAILPHTWKQLLFAIPMLWLSMWYWLFWQIIQLPLTICKFALSMIFSTPSERNRKKRTVLISGGSSVQALHLARNFHSAGARVIVVEIDGCFALARFSTAVSRFYTVPKPTSDQQQKYVRALCDIASREHAVYYIPVCATTEAYYDAVAKPHLELLGCQCFTPGIKEVRILDDILEVFKRCEHGNISTPQYHTISTKEELVELYDNGYIRQHVMQTIGAGGLRDRQHIILPRNVNEVKCEINPQRPWIVIPHIDGERFLTCTTVKQSQVIANVTCQCNDNGLMPVEHQQIERWLNNFFAKLSTVRPINGHVSFRFVVSRRDGIVYPLSARVGVSLPYICYTTVQPRLIMKPCRHFSRQNSGPLVAENGRYWMHETVLDTIRHPSVESVTRLIGTVLDKREVLFALWDPLPYCAYYHIQLPFRNFLEFVRRTHTTFQTPMTVN